MSELKNVETLLFVEFPTRYTIPLNRQSYNGMSTFVGSESKRDWHDFRVGGLAKATVCPIIMYT